MTLGIGVIGTGMIGRDHARRIAQALTGGYVVAVTDVNRASADDCAREVAPLTLEWNGLTLHTPPLTATGLLMLEALAILKAVDWARLPAPQRLHAKLEALRLAWADRLAVSNAKEQSGAH